MADAALDEVFQVFAVNAFDGRTVADALAVGKVEADRLVQRAGRKPRLKLGVSAANLVHLQAQRRGGGLRQNQHAPVFLREVLGAGTVAAQAVGDFLGERLGLVQRVAPLQNPASAFVVRDLKRLINFGFSGAGRTA